MELDWEAPPFDEVDPEEERRTFDQARQKLKERFAFYDSLASQLLERVGALNAPEKDAVLEKLRSLRFRLSQGPVRMLVLGASSSGKSTLINALAGRVVSPEGSWTTTRVTSWIQPGEQKGPYPDYYQLKYPDPMYQTGYYRTLSQFLTQFCYCPGTQTEKTEGTRDVMRVRVKGGFQEEMGLTLLDTPGVAQNEADTQTARYTIDMGAELLLFTIRSNVFNDREREIYAGLFDQPAFSNLEPQQEVFCVYNEDPLVPMPINVKSAFSTLTEKQPMARQVDTEGRIYAVNVLEERRKAEAYLYNAWAPNGINPDTVPQLSQWEAKEIEEHQRLGHQAPGEEMERLKNDLRLQIRLLYADPERICRPIVETLREALELVRADLDQRMEASAQQAAELVGATPDESFHSLLVDKIRQKRDGLAEKADSVCQQSKDYANVAGRLLIKVDQGLTTLSNANATPDTGKLLESLSANHDSFMNHQQKLLDAVSKRCQTDAAAWQNALMDADKFTKIPSAQDFLEALSTMKACAPEDSKLHKLLEQDARDFYKRQKAFLEDAKDRMTKAVDQKTEISALCQNLRSVMDRYRNYMRREPEGFLAHLSWWLEGPSLTATQNAFRSCVANYIAQVRKKYSEAYIQAVKDDVAFFQGLFEKDETTLQNQIKGLEELIAALNESIRTQVDALREAAKREAAQAACEEFREELGALLVTNLELLSYVKQEPLPEPDLPPSGNG